jgi:putative ABC transport system substrate-binding protein
MKRRDFIAGVGSAAAWPVVAAAQGSARNGRIGVLMGYAESDAEAQRWVTAFRKGLNDQLAGATIELNFRWATGSTQNIRSAAVELLKSAPDVVLAASSPALAAALQETRTVPIVFANVVDPVGQGFVASLAAPGGNVTGFTSIEFEIGGKWIEFLKAIDPRVRQAVVLIHPDTAPYHAAFQRSIDGAAAALGMKIARALVGSVAEIERRIDEIGVAADAGLIVMPSAFMTVHRNTIIDVVARKKIPTMYGWNYYARSGGLIAYGPGAADIFTRASTYVAKIINGASPASMPVQQPIKFELLVNVRTARALGIEVPVTLLARADEVIE